MIWNIGIMWDILLTNSVRVLACIACDFFQGNCMTAYDYREKIEQDIKTMGCEFLRKECFVPSFEEVYPYVNNQYCAHHSKMNVFLPITQKLSRLQQ